MPKGVPRFRGASTQDHSELFADQYRRSDGAARSEQMLAINAARKKSRRELRRTKRQRRLLAIANKLVALNKSR